MLCKNKRVIHKFEGEDTNGVRKRTISQNSVLWTKGKEISFSFLAGTGDEDEKEKNIIRKAFQAWQNKNIGLTFKEISEPEKAICRIGFYRGAGYWSYIGTENLYIKHPAPTMNFGDRLTDDVDGLHIAMHEIGHLIGMKHQHQNGNDPITWDVEQVNKVFSGNPNFWKKEDIDENILNLEQSPFYSSKIDPDSIMMYEFEPNLIIKPEKMSKGHYPKKLGTDIDLEMIRRNYVETSDKKPLVNKLDYKKVVKFLLATGKELHFNIKVPKKQYYRIRTFGMADTYCELNILNKNGTQTTIATDDNSGVSNNILIKKELEPNVDYVLKLKVNYSAPNDFIYLLYY